MTDQLIIFQKLYDLYLYTHLTAGKFPKSQRFLLSNHLLQTNMEMIKLTILANSKPDRLVEQGQISLNLDLFRIYVRIAKDTNFLSIKQHSHLTEKIGEIGKLLTAWKRVKLSSY